MKSAREENCSFSADFGAAVQRQHCFLDLILLFHVESIRCRFEKHTIIRVGFLGLAFCQDLSARAFRHIQPTHTQHSKGSPGRIGLDIGSVQHLKRLSGAGSSVVALLTDAVEAELSTKLGLHAAQRCRASPDKFSVV